MGLTTEDLVNSVSPKIGSLGAAFYFTPPTLAMGKELGLDGFRFYVLGRGGVLGATNAATVHSAFGYFSPKLVERMWTTAAEVADPLTTAGIYYEACANHGRAKLGDLDLTAFCAAADQVVEAADGAGMPLFAGIRSLPRVADLPGRAAQLIAVLREFRGSAHLAAVRAAGLDSHIAHFIKRPTDIELFGYPADAGEEVTDEDRAKLAEAERMTDRIVMPAFAVLDESHRQALLDGVTAIEAAYAA